VGVQAVATAATLNAVGMDGLAALHTRDPFDLALAVQVAEATARRILELERAKARVWISEWAGAQRKAMRRQQRRKARA
jgi:hypothetical protein